MPHIYTEWGQHWFRYWLVAYLAPSHYLNQCWVLVNWTLRNKLQRNFNQNTKLFIHKSASENIVCEMVAILSRGRWVNRPQGNTGNNLCCLCQIRGCLLVHRLRGGLIVKDSREYITFGTCPIINPGYHWKVKDSSGMSCCCINSLTLWPSDTIWRNRSGLTLA